MKLVTCLIDREEAPVLVQEPTNRILVIDCSGSMSSELPKLRTHLKNKLPTLVQPQDTLTIVWFSGKGQYGILFEGIKLDNLSDIAKVNDAIDRFLRPIGMTAFVQPLEEVLALTKRLSGNCTLSFLTDGHDNSYTHKQIIDACKPLSDVISCATFVEYGYYAAHQTLMDMAEEVSGSVIMADDFQSYTEKLEQSFKKTTSSKKLKVKRVFAEYVVGNQPDGFVIARPDAIGTVTLPADTTSYSYFEGDGTLDDIGDSLQQATYMVSALIQRGKSDLALEVASRIGDITLFQQLQNSFSKQDYMMSVELANSYGSSKKKLFTEAPRNTKLVQDPNAYNVLTLLMDLTSEPGNYLDLSHESFQYNAIGDSTKTVETEEGYTPKFTDTSKNIKAEITTLKFNEDRPNISMLVKRSGTVNLPKNDLGFEDNFNSFIWRNYTIVKDGIVNVRLLPVVLSKSTYDLLTQLGVINEPFKVGKTFVIDTRKYPIINKSMTTKTTSKEMFTDCFNLYKLRAQQKYLGSKVEKPEFSEKFAGLYGEDGAKFLKECGITEGGFSPKTVKGTSVDPYMSKVLEIKLSGLSSIPKVEDVEKAIASGKNLTPSQKVMGDVIKMYESSKDLEGDLKIVKNEIKFLMNKIVMKKFGIIIGKTWFTDMTSYEDNVKEMDFKLGKMITCTALLEDKEV